MQSEATSLFLLQERLVPFALDLHRSLCSSSQLVLYSPSTGPFVCETSGLTTAWHNVVTDHTVGLSACRDRACTAALRSTSELGSSAPGLSAALASALLHSRL